MRSISAPPPSAIAFEISNSRLASRCSYARHRAVHPTPQGKALAAATGRAFAELARAAPAGRRRPGRQRLKLKVFPLFASAWLIPRLARFRREASGYRSCDRDLQPCRRFRRRGLRCRHQRRRRLFEGLVSHALSPTSERRRSRRRSLVRRLRLREPRDLGRAVLIHVTTFPAAWPQWLERAGRARTRAVRDHRGRQFRGRHPGGRAGAGSRSAWNLFIAERERQARSAVRFRSSHPPGSYWLVHPPGCPAQPRAATLQELAACRASRRTAERSAIDDLSDSRCSQIEMSRALLFVAAARRADADRPG